MNFGVEKRPDGTKGRDILEYEWMGNLANFIEFLKSEQSPKMGKVAHTLFKDLSVNVRDELIINRRNKCEPDIVHIGDLITYDSSLNVDDNYFITRKTGESGTYLSHSFFRHFPTAQGYLSHLIQFLSLDIPGIDEEVEVKLKPEEGLILVVKNGEKFSFDPRKQTVFFDKEKKKYGVCDIDYANIIF